MELLPQLVRRQQEELIIDQVALPPEWLEEQRQAFLEIRVWFKCWKPEVGLSLISISISAP